MRNYLIILLLCLSGHHVTAEPVAKGFFENHEVTRDANVGVLVVDLLTGDTIDAYRANNLLPTASTMKVITTCAALESLGPDFRWTTTLLTDSIGEDGTIGDLYVVGEGDPTLLTRTEGPDGEVLGDTLLLEHWAEALQARGVKRVAGRVIADMGQWDNDDAANPGWTWDDMGNYYGMAVTPLSYRDNTLKIYLNSGAAGSHAEVVRTDPVVDGLTIESHVSCDKISYDDSYVRGIPFSAYRLMVGRIPSNRGEFRVRGDLPNPGLCLVSDLKKRLEEAGIEVAGGVAEKRTYAPLPSGAVVLHAYKSPTLAEVMYETNQSSNNQFAEMIFRTLGKSASKVATVEASRQAIADIWKARGVAFETAKQLDGCGLAPQNAVAPTTFVSLLRYMYTSPYFETFKASLPVSGESGTLKSMLRGTRLHGKVYAKSGTISGLRAYAGYIFLDEQHVWAFSIVVNNGKGGATKVRKTIEEYLLLINGRRPN